MSKTKKEYPTWICHPCGLKFGRKGAVGTGSTEATYHEGVCDVCGNKDMVTEPRDYGHLKDGWSRVRKKKIIL